MTNFSPDPNPLRVLSFGAGAIGTYIGGSLALHGHTVVFLERPPVAAELQARGLHLTLPSNVQIVNSPMLAGTLVEALSLSPFDVAIFALKSFDTVAVMKDIRPYATDIPPILCLQNGVENEPAIAAVIGEEKVIYGTVTSAIGRNGPGDIVLEKLRGIGLSGSHPLTERLVQALDTAGLNAHLFHRPADMKWSKMLTNLLANATSAILDMTPARIFAHPGLYQLEIAQLREALSVMRAQGIRAINLPRTPVRFLAFGVKWLPTKLLRPLIARQVGGGRGGKMPSFYIDLHSGRGQSEVDYLNGAVVRFGARLGIPTPANQVLNDTLLTIARREVKPDTYSGKPDALLERFHHASKQPWT